MTSLEEVCRLTVLALFRRLELLVCMPQPEKLPNGSFRKLGVPYLGVLTIRILLFRLLY